MTRSRLAIVLVCCAFACTADPPRDAGITVDPATSFDQPIGAPCDANASFLCAKGVGACHDAICVEFCRAVEFPRCRSGTTEVHATAGDREVCLCAPAP